MQWLTRKLEKTDERIKEKGGDNGSWGVLR